ncbi:hypothetical protein AU467_27995 [Mesorhizobium loti]|uniref:Uncharacterized protein n=1 Tax=Rhizobium loti TaxID=381 RepID=A0A117N2J5_RHILI|nr:hypothetical protein AU467_27995 [Mesorhizobium loti]
MTRGHAHEERHQLGDITCEPIPENATAESSIAPRPVCKECLAKLPPQQNAASSDQVIWLGQGAVSGDEIGLEDAVPVDKNQINAARLGNGLVESCGTTEPRILLPNMHDRDRGRASIGLNHLGCG